MVNTFVHKGSPVLPPPSAWGDLSVFAEREAPRPRAEVEMVEAARNIITGLLNPIIGAGTITIQEQIDLAKWVVLNFWTPD